MLRPLCPRSLCGTALSEYGHNDDKAKGVHSPLNPPYVNWTIPPILPEARMLLELQIWPMAPILRVAPVPDPLKCFCLICKIPNIHALRERCDVFCAGARMQRMAQNRDLVRRTRPKLTEVATK